MVVQFSRFYGSPIFEVFMVGLLCKSRCSDLYKTNGMADRLTQLQDCVNQVRSMSLL